MKRSIFFTSMYIIIFLIVSVPLILNIKINDLSIKISDLDTEIFILQREKMLINLAYNDKFSISSIEKLANAHSYERLEIFQKINKLEIPYKLKNQEEENIAILGFSK